MSLLEQIIVLQSLGGCNNLRTGTSSCPGIVVVEVVQVLADDSTQPLPEWREQYINPNEDHNHPNYGRRLRLKARVECAGAGTGSLIGHQVYWRFTSDLQNRPNSLSPLAELPRRMRVGFNTPGGDETCRTSVVTEDGWTEIVDFYLSAVGGDKFAVYATENSENSGGIRAGSWTVWRKIWYEVDYMAKPGGGRYGSSLLINQAKREFRRAYIELEETAVSSTLAPHRRLLMGHSDPALDTVEDYLDSIRGRRNWRRYVHILFADAYSDMLRTQPRTFDLSDPYQTMSFSANRYTFNESDWLIRAEITQSGATATITPPLDPQNPKLVLAEREDRWEVSLNPSQHARILLNNGNQLSITTRVRVRLEFKYWVVPGGVTIMDRQTIVIPGRWMEREGAPLFAEGVTQDEFAQRVLNHELGHAFGLASQRLPDGTRNRQTYYDRGPHCHGLIGENRCCMSLNAPHASLEFCDNCRAALRCVNLSRVPVAPGGDFTF